jgi:hypothetical protein
MIQFKIPSIYTNFDYISRMRGDDQELFDGNVEIFLGRCGKNA